eukprot:gb/GECH01011544.1/.p1 GENE.gb/GECH01011544.1/~~gb/GECH01011544.1/.p1  ORF type:complete len:101 (+),score=20.36 gb/GECH01011544.1/:1-303(+)
MIPNLDNTTETNDLVWTATYRGPPAVEFYDIICTRVDDPNTRFTLRAPPKDEAINIDKEVGSYTCRMEASNGVGDPVVTPEVTIEIKAMHLGHEWCYCYL